MDKNTPTNVIPLYPGEPTHFGALEGALSGPAFGHEFAECDSRLEINLRRAGRPGDRRRAWPIEPVDLSELIAVVGEISISLQAAAAIALEFQVLLEAHRLIADDLARGPEDLGAGAPRIASELSVRDSSYMSALVFRSAFAAPATAVADRLLLPVRVTDSLAEEPLAVLRRFKASDLDVAVACEIKALAAGLTMSEWLNQLANYRRLPTRPI